MQVLISNNYEHHTEMYLQMEIFVLIGDVITNGKIRTDRKGC